MIPRTGDEKMRRGTRNASEEKDSKQEDSRGGKERFDVKCSNMDVGS